MAFSTSISGLLAAQKDMLSVITSLMSEPQVLSAAMPCRAVYRLSGRRWQLSGQGVTLERIRQDFGQGGFEFTSSQPISPSTAMGYLFFKMVPNHSSLEPALSVLIAMALS